MRVGQQNTFCQFQFKESGREARFIQDFSHFFREPVLPELNRGYIHGDRNDIQAVGLPLPQVGIEIRRIDWA